MQRRVVERLGAWVLSSVASELAGWQATRDLTVAVNLSVRQLHDPGLLPALRRVAPATGSRTRLRLEVTESALMADPETAARLLRQIHELSRESACARRTGRCVVSFASWRSAAVALGAAAAGGRRSLLPGQPRQP